MAQDIDAGQGAQWYVVHTYSGYENKVASNIQTLIKNERLHDLIQDVKIPTEIVPEIKDGVEREVERKLFPSYVLVKMVLTDDSWYLVRNTRGVTGFVGPSSKPVPLSQAEVDKLGIGTEAAPEPSVRVDYKAGDNVEIIDGPFEGLIGVVDNIDLTAKKVRIKVNMFGRETPAELELIQVKPL